MKFLVKSKKKKRSLFVLGLVCFGCMFFLCFGPSVTKIFRHLLSKSFIEGIHFSKSFNQNFDLFI